MKLLRRFDDGLARGEAALAVIVLIAMILLGTGQALVRNIATLGEGIQWAHDTLTYFSWIDDFLKKGTLWLAFLGASLATREERHIAIDVLPRIASRRVKMLLKGLASIGAAIVSLFLARAFWGAVEAAAMERPSELEVYEGMSPIHVCDATAATLAAEQRDAPAIFCLVRDALDLGGIPVETPWATFQLIVPVMFVIMALRFVGHGVSAFRDMNRPEPAPENA